VYRGEKKSNITALRKLYKEWLNDIEKVYTIAVGSYCEPDLEVHDTEEDAKKHCDEENEYIIKEVFDGDEDAWVSDGNSTEYLIFTKEELLENHPEVCENYGIE
jgi:hypothetical protein